MTRFLIDSDCAIYAMSGQFPALGARLVDCEPGEIAISVISFAELKLGTMLGRPPPDDVFDAFLAIIPMLAFDEAAARAYAALPFRRARFDRLLAAHAISLNATIVTNNERDFNDVPGLRIENWTL